MVGATLGVPASKGPDIVLAGSDINALHGVLVVPVDVGLGIVPVSRLVDAVCDVPVNTGTYIVPVDREVDNS